MADRSARLDFILALTDKVSAPLGKVKMSFSDLANQSGENIKQMGIGLAGMVGAGMAITESLQPALEMNRALGEVRSLGAAEDALDALNNKALEFSVDYGENAQAFVASAYLIDGAIKGLAGEQLAVFTNTSNVLAKATKTDAATMGEYVGTLYNLQKSQADAMGKGAWVEQLGGQTALAVQLFRTSGAAMKDAFKEAGAIATTAGVDLAEQMAVIGTLSSTMEGGDAGGRYKAFFENIGAASEKLGIKFTDQQGKILPMMDILDKLQGKYGDLTSASAGAKLMEAFGGEGAQVIGALAKDTDRLRNGIDQLGNVRGLENAEKMAKAMVDPWQQFGAAVQALRIAFGQSLIPILSPLMERLTGIASTLTRWTKLFPNITRLIGITVLTVFGLTAAMALLTFVVGVSKLVWLAMVTVWKVLTWTGFRSIAMFLYHTVIIAAFVIGMIAMVAWMGMVRSAMLLWQAAIWLTNTALLANPITWIVIGIVALVAAVAAAIYYWDDWTTALMNSEAFKWVSDQFQALSNWFGSMGGWSGMAKAAWDSIVAVFYTAIDGLIAMMNTIPGVNIETTFGEMPTPPAVPEVPGASLARAPGVAAPGMLKALATDRPPAPLMLAQPAVLQPELKQPAPLKLPQPSVLQAAPVTIGQPQVKVPTPIVMPQQPVIPAAPPQLRHPEVKQPAPIMLPPASADVPAMPKVPAGVPGVVEKVVALPEKADQGQQLRKTINEAVPTISPTRPLAVPKGGLMQTIQNTQNQRPTNHVEKVEIHTDKAMSPLELENMMAMAVGG